LLFISTFDSLKLACTRTYLYHHKEAGYILWLNQLESIGQNVAQTSK